jgi:hypothetical protein
MGWLFRRFSLTKAVPLANNCGTTGQVEHLELLRMFKPLLSTWRSYRPRRRKEPFILVKTP